MARLALAALLAPLGRALIISQQDDSKTRDCLCLDWNEVYKKEKNHNVSCGDGMEFFFLMDTLNVSSERDVHHKVSLGKSNHASQQLLKQLQGSEIYYEFCTNFFNRAHFNYCVNKRYQMTREQVPTSKGTWCYVSNKCELPNMLTPIPGTDLAVKQCSDISDVSLGSMPIEEAAKVATKQNLDHGLLAGHAYIWKDMLVKELDGATLRDIMESNEGTYVYSMKDMFAPRWVINGTTVYEETYNDTQSTWSVKCIRDCLW